MKNIIGINNDGSILRVLLSLSFKILRPEANISIPPTIDSSAKRLSEKKDADKYLATK